MGNFPKIVFKNFEGWVPETDVDGVDIKESFVSDISVFRFMNGFVENSLNQIEITLPSNVSDAITQGYELLSSHQFTHSEQGDKRIYVLWKESASSTQKLRIYLDNDLLSLDPNNVGLDFSDKPNKINYNLVNDELKINLNCTGSYGGKDVILNYSLQYLDEITYNSANNVSRAAGWYICPRWLGWNTFGLQILQDKDTTYLEDFEDTTYKFALSLNDFGRTTADKYEGSYSIVNTNTTDTKNNKYFSITYDDITIIEFYAKTSDGGLPRVWLYVEGTAGESYRIITQHSYQEMSNGWYKIWFDVNAEGTGRTVRICIAPNNTSIGASSVTYTFPTVYIDNLTVLTTTDAGSLPTTRYYVVLGKYFDGQRALLGITSNALNQIEIEEDYIDWRITAYEIYSYDQDTKTWFLLSEIDVDDNWEYNAGKLTNTFPYTSDLDKNVSLDFRYNLPALTRVDTQSYIYMEIAYKGRVYFIKEDHKVYQSHIAGNGVIQPDSFPYDESQGFGYFVVSRTNINKALAVSPTNDLVVYTDRSFHVYQIQPSGATVFRRLRLVSGSIGIASPQSLAKAEDGNPSTSGLIWCDYNGIYYYGGGIEQPINLLYPSHLQYWLNISTSEKDSAVAFYNERRKQYTIYIDQKLIDFELEYKRFKYSTFSKIDEYVGISDNILYFRDGNRIYKFTDNSYQVAKLATHYNTGYGMDRFGRQYKMDENDHKILQEGYVIFGDDTDADADIEFTFYYDGHQYEKTIKIDAEKKYWKIPLPIIRFRRIKAQIEVKNSKRVIIKEIGFGVTTDGKEALGANV